MTYYETPPKIIEEFKRQWSKVEKVSLDEFILIHTKDRDFYDWFAGYDDMKNYHESYVEGSFRRYSSHLPTKPEDVWHEVVNEANDMIIWDATKYK